MRSIYIFCLLFTITLSNKNALAKVNAHENRSSTKPTAIDLDFIIKDLGMEISETILGLEIYKSYSEFGVLTGSKSYDLKLIKSNEVSQHIILPNDNSFLKINFKIGRKTVLGFGSIFMVEAGDNLKCELYRDSIHFSGIGAEKMNLQYRLAKIINKYRIPVRKVIPSEYFQNEERLIEKELQEQLTLLNQHRTLLSSRMYNYINGQCHGLAKYRLMGSINASRVKGDELRLVGQEFFQRKLKNDGILSQNNIDLCSYYVDYLYLKEKYEYQLAKNLDKSIDATMFIPKLSEKYHKGLLGKLLVISFSNLPMYNDGKDLFSLIDSAIVQVDTEPYGSLLLKIRESRASRSLAFPFALPDTTKKIVRMEDFRGKVLILDFWFSGCKPCMDLTVNMKDALKKINDEDVVVISINVDKNELQWKESIKSGLYTHEGYINLNASSSGSRHQILNHYSIIGFPQLVIIDREGKIISSTPPTPIKKESIDKFVDFFRSIL